MNGAAFWNQASAHLGVVSAIAVAPSDSNIVAVGTAAGFVHRTDKGLISGGSTTWPGVRVVPNGAFISSIVFDSYDPDVMYVTSSSFKSSPDESHVYRSVDSGLTWVGIDGTGDTALPDIPVHVIVVDPIHTERLFIGTDAGVFVSSDGGATWAVEETGFPNVSTESLAINTYCSEPTLFAFTHGRGAWKVPIEGDCHYELSSAGATVPDLGDTGELTITTSAGCGWSAVSESDWITLESGGCGEANGTVRFTVARNLLATPRTGTIRIAGNVFTVEQAERPCVLSLSSPSSTHGAKAAPGSFAISVGAACEWSAVSNAPWIVVTSATAGRGPASLTYAIAANEGPPRIGTIRADDQVFTIRQAQPSPTVQSASPGQGCPGQPVVITGSHFLGATGVYFNGIPSTSFTVMSDTNISAIVPEGDISGPVTVATPGGFSAGEGVFEVNPGPTILDITPPVGIEGLEVTIHGRNLKGVTAVRFEGAPPVAVHARSASTIKVTVPKGIRNGPLGLEAAGACREVQSSFPFYAYPFIRSVSARGGHWGTLMSMSGVNLGGATAVTFRGLPATFVVLADEVILVIIPVGARRGAIQVHTPGGIAVSPIFTAYP